MVLKAVSTAVEPPVVKKTLFKSPGAISAIFFDSMAEGCVELVKGEVNGNLMT